MIRARQAKYITLFFAFFITAIALADELKEASFEVLESGKNTESRSFKNKLAENTDITLRMIVSSLYRDIRNTSRNPENNLFYIPSYEHNLIMRPDLRFHSNRLDLSIKPRMTLQWIRWENGMKKDDHDTIDEWYVNEWLFRLNAADNLYLSYGRENLQWGPSQLASISNPFFFENGRRNPKKEIEGMDFARAVYLVDPQWTLSFIANTDEGRQESTYTQFNKTYAIKLDFAGNKGYGSIIFSHEEGDPSRIGGYLGTTVTDALLLYSEANIQNGSNALFPVSSDGPYHAEMKAAKKGFSGPEGLLLVGGSYTFSTGPTLFVEYVFNSMGYNEYEAEMYYQLRRAAAEDFTASGRNRTSAEIVLNHTADTGLELLRRNYLLLQLTHNDIKDVLDLTFRWTFNLDDSSGQMISMVEYYLGDHLQLFSIANINSGPRNSEFGDTLNLQWTVGVEYMF